MRFPLRRARGTALLPVWLIALSFVVAPAGHASPKTFSKADAAWHSGELEGAKDLYEQALSEGDLNPDDVVIAYSRIGTVKAAMRDNPGALSAFRIAAAIDPAFELPPDSGPKAKELYAQARKEAGDQGLKLDITVNAPKEIPRREAFTIEVEIPEGFAVLVAQVVVTLEDKGAGKSYKKSLQAEPSLSFEFPGKVAQSGARFKVRAAAVDSQNNAWAVAETKMKVEGASSAGSEEEEEAGPVTWGSQEVDPFAEEGQKQGGPKKEKSFFEKPVGWAVIGGGALVVVGAVLFASGAFSSPDSVNVKAPEWR